MSGAAARAVHNARVQLLATALNNLGVAAIVAGVVAPMASGSFSGAGHIIAWLVLGADLIGLAHAVLGRLR